MCLEEFHRQRFLLGCIRCIKRWILRWRWILLSDWYVESSSWSVRSHDGHCPTSLDSIFSNPYGLCAYFYACKGNAFPATKLVFFVQNVERWACKLVCFCIHSLISVTDCIIRAFDWRIRDLVCIVCDLNRIIFQSLYKFACRRKVVFTLIYL